MRNLALTIAKALQAIEQERGPFKVKCLVAQDPEDIQWDLILWADWFEEDEFKRLDYLIEKIIKPLDQDALVQFNGIITFGSSDENNMLKALRQIQNNVAKGFYRTLWDGDILEISANLPQARLVVPLNLQLETEKQSALA
ncbi:hypothetical protein [Halochromatium roseum]|uniref:hypothetical protein n=1 Tax=Halochromatium roseum TaxID=391920 RepID=UPI0019148374|nr:hypothetical protein [Halochromatium roseum]MBK5941843.1 hypothetical protein [Halochromatium roseum]MCF7980318.1 hypothetical protein [Chromatiaceae bacterium]MCF7996771.1 hypothetical protein [Chromatiaceae bacterium]MCF8003003.1 hypothetical protein [Chromatiaceae bacterium]